MSDPGTAAWLSALLRDRLGPDAELGALTFEGRLVHLEGARLPLGPSAALHVERVTVELGAGLPLGELPLSARLVALRCELRTSRFTLPIDFTPSEAGREAWAHGNLRLGPPPGVEGILSVDPTGWSFANESFRGWGRLPFAATSAGAPLLALRIVRGDVPFLARIASATGIELPALPDDLLVSGELMVAPDRAVSGSFTLETPRSSLRLGLTIAEGGSLLGSTLRGRFAAADAITVGLFPKRLHPRPEDVLTLDARLGGTVARPSLTGRLAAAHVSLEAGAAVFEIERASVLLDAGRDGLAWQQLTGAFSGGTFTSSGRIGWRTGTIEATVSAGDVRIETLPFRAARGEGGTPPLAGRISGEVRFERGSRAEHALAARGRLTVESPVYHFVRAFAPALARYGLPPLRARAPSPLTVALRLDRDEIVVEPIAASLDGIDVDGTLRVGEGGRLLGRVQVHLLEGYLSRSPLLSIPAALSKRVTVPVYLSGPPGALSVRTSALEILDGLLAGRRAVIGIPRWRGRARR